jgi:chitodextrinase
MARRAWSVSRRISLLVIIAFVFPLLMVGAAPARSHKVRAAHKSICHSKRRSRHRHRARGCKVLLGTAKRIKTNSTPSPPSSLVATARNNQITVSWKASTDAVDRVAGYYIYRNHTEVADTTSTSYTDTGLTDGTSYSYYVDAHDTSGYVSTPSSTVSATPLDTSPPTAPSNLTATTGSQQVSLSWDASTDNVSVAGYYIYRSGAQVGQTAGTSYTDTGLTDGTSYSYYVEAYDEAGNVSVASNTVSATPADTTPPTAPTNLVATAGNTQVSLSWFASTDNVGVTGYDVFRNGTKVATTTRTSYTDNGLTDGTSYSDYVEAFDAAGNVSGPSNTVSATPAATTGGILYGSGPYSEGSWPPGNWDPYASTSPYNQQLPAPSLAPLDPSSASTINYIATQYAVHAFLNTEVSNTPSKDDGSNWMHPLYWAKTSDPTYTIHSTEYACVVGVNATACPTTVQIPNGAQHALAGDGHLAVVQPDGHTEIDFWQVQNSNPISGGGTLTASAYGALDLNGNGCCSNSTAAHQGLQAGEIRGPELAAGVINHALIVTLPCSNGTYVYPATGLTATCSNTTNAPALGARFQLNETDAQIDAQSVPTYVKIIEKAMEHYGVYFTDNGGQMDLAFEPALDYTSFGNTSNTVMSYLLTQGLTDPTYLALGNNIPLTKLQVVAVCYTQGTC